MNKEQCQHYNVDDYFEICCDCKMTYEEIKAQLGLEQ